MESIVYDKAFWFSIKIYNLYKYLVDDKKEIIISKQILRSGTSIGANIKEALQAQSKKDFICKMSIALKEASETEYWLDILKAVNLVESRDLYSVVGTCKELNKMLIAIVKTTKEKQQYS